VLDYDYMITLSVVSPLREPAHGFVKKIETELTLMPAPAAGAGISLSVVVATTGSHNGCIWLAREAQFNTIVQVVQVAPMWALCCLQSR